MTGDTNCSTSKKVIILANTLIQSGTNNQPEISLITEDQETISYNKENMDEIYPTTSKSNAIVPFVETEIYSNDTLMTEELVELSTRNQSTSINETEKASDF